MEPDGIILIDKPKGITSHSAVYRMRRLLRTQKIGHTGTLDPDATGLLVVLVGRAAKAAEYITSDEKEYEAI
ncbi:MAG: tRNA pseudouridine(55) synthase TruB, partial [Clostridia bacterium]|nr:tRNA pseudouridine(55) synthase TruB [Clostridia bacterium]